MGLFGILVSNETIKGLIPLENILPKEVIEQIDKLKFIVIYLMEDPSRLMIDVFYGYLSANWKYFSEEKIFKKNKP